MRHPTLRSHFDIDQDAHFHRHAWIVQRIGWTAMALIAMAGLLGLLGRGPISSAAVESGDRRIRVQYDRFERHEAPTTFTITVDRRSGAERAARVWITREWLAGMRIDTVTPEPAAVEADSDRLIYTFRTPEPDAPLAITFHAQPQQIGRRTARIGVVDGPEIGFWQFVYP